MQLLPSTSCKRNPFRLVGTNLPPRFLIRDHHCPSEKQIDAGGEESRLPPVILSNIHFEREWLLAVSGFLRML
jgi:hypothetical protein